jgi:formylglycine-generating enzyme required for sulfatase activity/tRNA A-37 threonylcarbamoyl transferase component Bud32
MMGAAASCETFRVPELPGYQILEKIGEGASGAVYRAYQASLDRSVAIKFVTQSDDFGRAERLERFQREARLLAKVAHPHVLAVYDAGLCEHGPYLITEYLDGGNLRTLMKAGRPLPPAMLLRVIEPVIGALSALHHEGIVHRDLKPENILLQDPGHPKVGDFGIAVLIAEVGSLTWHGQVFGTLGYTAPEQQYGLPIDQRVDQYSLAAMVYEMLTGGELPLGVIRKPSELNYRLDRQVDKVLMRALAQQPEERFASIGEFGAALRAALTGAASASRRRRWLAIGGILAALLAGTALGWFGLPGNREAGRPAERSGGDPGPLAAKTVNSLGMELVLIEPGEVRVLPIEAHQDPSAGSSPGRLLRVEGPFYLGACEVTVGQFRDFVADSGYRTTAELDGGGFTFDEKSGQMRQLAEVNWRNPGVWNKQQDDHPVVQVSWEDAQAFCAWLSQRESLEYRLPTEAEWEYGCRAGSPQKWPMDDAPARLEDYTWYAANSGHALHPVHSKLPNGFGLYHMLGNVQEWCADAHHVENDRGDESPFRPVRGGAIDTPADMTHSASGQYSYPAYRCRTYGFRVARSVPGG